MSCQPFAIMRLTHEAIRRGLEEAERVAAAGGAAGARAAAPIVRELAAVISLHADQEDGAFYPPLHEKVADVARPFTTTHDAERGPLAGLASRLADATDADAAERLAELAQFIAAHRDHLKQEEDVLQPLLPKEFTYPESVGVVRGIIAHAPDRYSDALPWIFARLNPGQRPMYLAMLTVCSPPGQRDALLARLAPQISEAERAKYLADGVLPA